MTDTTTATNNDTTALMELIAELSNQIKDIKESKAKPTEVVVETIDPLLAEQQRIEKENSLREEIKKEMHFKEELTKFNTTWQNVLKKDDKDIEMIDRLNASNEYKLAKKLDKIFSIEDNKQILSKDILNNLNSFLNLKEEDKMNKVSSIYLEVKDNFFENLDKIEQTKAKLMNTGVIFNPDNKVNKDPIINKALNNTKFKAIP
jgi:hypothetical protein